jgi:hypothetical protein
MARAAQSWAVVGSEDKVNKKLYMGVGILTFLTVAGAGAVYQRYPSSQRPYAINKQDYALADDRRFSTHTKNPFVTVLPDHQGMNEGGGPPDGYRTIITQTAENVAQERAFGWGARNMIGLYNNPTVEVIRPHRRVVVKTITKTRTYTE